MATVVQVGDKGGLEVGAGRLRRFAPYDLAQLLGAAVLGTIHREVPIAPTRIGKYATFWIAATVVLSLAWELLEWPPAEAAPYVAAVGLVGAECIAVSFVQYFLFFVRSAQSRDAS